MQLDPENLRREGLVASLAYRPEVDSTNRLAQRAAEGNRPDLPAVFVAERQTAGRGRDGRVWVSRPGCLTFSLLVKRPVPVDDPRNRQIALLVGVAICRWLEESTPLTARLKWPNDIILRDRKLAGILIETAGPDCLVIGCGINIANPVDDVPGAISLVQCLPEPPGLTESLTQLCRSLLSRLAEFPANAGQQLQEARQLDWLAGRSVIWSGNPAVPATAWGIHDDGGMELKFSGTSGPQVVYTGSLSVLGQAACQAERPACPPPPRESGGKAEKSG